MDKPATIRTRSSDKPIYYGNLIIRLHKRGNAWEESTYKIDGVVMSGTDEEIKKDKRLLRKIIVRIKGPTGRNFDLSRMRVEEVIKERRMGLGFYNGNKN